jgi:phosphomannomutase
VTDQQAIEPQMKEMLLQLRQKVVVGVVGGSDLNKQKEQLGANGTNQSTSLTSSY